MHYTAGTGGSQSTVNIIGEMGKFLPQWKLHVHPAARLKQSEFRKRRNKFNSRPYLVHSLSSELFYRGADKSLVRPGRKQANISVRMSWISFGALACRKKKTWQLASRCCWNRARPWHASELVSFLVGLRTFQHTGKMNKNNSQFARDPVDIYDNMALNSS